MQLLIKTFTSGRCAGLTPALVVLGMLVLLSQSVASQDGQDDSKAWNITTLDRLHVQLFTNYDKNSQPTYREMPTNITLGISINYIDIDELNGKMTLHAWLRLTWMDENRSWNARDYDNITQIHLRPKEVWKPDITLFNSAGEEGNYLGETQILLSNDGTFLWVPPVVYAAYCNLNLRLWPYDSQLCKVKIGSWTLTYIDPKHLEAKNDVDYSDLVQSTEWEIVDVKAEYRKKDYYNYVEYAFGLQRRSTMYAAVIFTPASCIILLALSTFWLPPQMSEKILLNGIVIIVIAAFLMYFAQLLPILAENTPLIVLFYSTSLLLLSLSTIVAVTVLYLATAKHKRRLPDFLKKLLNGPLGRVLLLSHFMLEAEPQSLLNGTKELGENVYDSPPSPHQQQADPMADPLTINTSPEPSGRSIQFDWVLLATAIDRICFLIFCLIFIILAVEYSV